MKVLKFGGTSLADADRFLHVAELIIGTGQGTTTTTVLSAPKGITNDLESLVANLRDGQDAQRMVNDISAKLSQLVTEISTKLPEFNVRSVEQALVSRMQKLDKLVSGAELLSYVPKHVHAILRCQGEYVSADIMQAILSAKSIPCQTLDPVSFVVTDKDLLNGEVDIDASREKYRQLQLPGACHFIVPGFTGADGKGRLSTLGRNGSDYSAAVVAVCAEAECCEIWTDVDGVYNADPRQVSDAHLVEHLSYQEAMELSYFGAKVLHPKTIAPIARFHIPCRIKNTLNPQGPGSLIDGNCQGGNVVKGISSLEELVMVNVSGPGMKGMVGMAARIFDAMSLQDISVVLITQSSSEYSISFCIHAVDAERARLALAGEFELELKNALLDPVDVAGDLAIVSLVGDGMRQQQGVAAKFFSSLAQARVNVVAIAQDSSERSISAVIESRKCADAVKVCHQNFFTREHSIDLFVVGSGVVGGELLNQIARQQSFLAEQHVSLNVYGLATSKGVVLDAKGLPLKHWPDMDKSAAVPLSVATLKDFVRKNHLINPVLVDCTSSDALAGDYLAYLQEGFHVVTPNKKANTGSLDYYNALRQAATKHRRRFLYETNVGAGLPVVDTLQGLLNAGDELLQFEGVLSGSLSYIFGMLEQGMSLADATQTAKDKGFTEPDPRDDLSGMDVARKVLIMAREAGMQLSLDDVDVQSVLPQGFDASGSVDEFMQSLPQANEAIAAQVAQAKSQGKVLRYVGRIFEQKCEVSIQAVDASHPLYAIKDGENALSFVSRYYNPIPLVLRGYGAGAAVTAAGVFGDIMRTLAWKQEV